MMETSTATQKQEQEQEQKPTKEHPAQPQEPTKCMKMKPPQIILGITGSVASIKGPELALSLAKILKARVIVVLTQGGTNFWYKAKEYNELKWNEYCAFMGCNTDTDVNADVNTDVNADVNTDVNTNISAGAGTNASTNTSTNGSISHGEKSVFSMLETTKIEESIMKNSNTGTGTGTGTGTDAGTTNNNHKEDHFLGEISICHAQDEWNEWNKIGDPVLHIQLRDWADMIILAPLSAHTLAKVSTGLCDDTLSCILRAWDYGNGYRNDNGNSNGNNNDNGNSNGCMDSNNISKKNIGKPIIIAPAMNTAMWEHPVTKQQLDIMKGFWKSVSSSNSNSNSSSNSELCKTYIVDPQVKTLACGDTGKGAMANVLDIVNVARKCLGDSNLDSDSDSL